MIVTPIENGVAAGGHAAPAASPHKIKDLLLFYDLLFFFNQVSEVAHDSSWNRKSNHSVQTCVSVDDVRDHVYAHSDSSQTAFDFRAVY